MDKVKAQENAGQVTDLVRLLQSQNANVRSAAADTLGRIGPDAKEGKMTARPPITRKSAVANKPIPRQSLRRSAVSRIMMLPNA